MDINTNITSPLKKALYNETKKTFTITDPVRKFFVEIDRTVIPNTNYYFCLFIREQLIAFTNKFIYDGKLYELDLFMENIILPMDILFEDNDSITFCGIVFDSNDMSRCLDKITKLYYEPVIGYKPIIKKYDIHFPEDDSFIPKFVQEDIIVFHNSSLADYVRNKFDNSFCQHFYGPKTDIVIRYVDGKCFSVYNKIKIDIK